MSKSWTCKNSAKINYINNDFKSPLHVVLKTLDNKNEITITAGKRSRYKFCGYKKWNTYFLYVNFFFFKNACLIKDLI